MERNLVKGILATVQNDGADLTEFKPAVLDFDEREALLNALGCVACNFYFLTINGIDCMLFIDNLGVHDGELLTTMIVKIDGNVAQVFSGNYFICKSSHGRAESLSDAECETILGNLKITAFGYYTSRYLLIDL